MAESWNYARIDSSRTLSPNQPLDTPNMTSPNANLRSSMPISSERTHSTDSGSTRVGGAGLGRSTGDVDGELVLGYGGTAERGMGAYSYASRNSANSIDSMGHSQTSRLAHYSAHTYTKPEARYTPVSTTHPEYPSAAWCDLDEPDDLHDPDPPGKTTERFDIMSSRGWINMLTIFIVTGALLMLFGGWPIIAYFQHYRHIGGLLESGANTSGYNLGGINATGQIPLMANHPSLIDDETPADAYYRTGFDGNQWDLVFSDEFEENGRSFYDGDDPYWQGVDLHYWGTNDFQWYDPGAITTANGKLVITMTEEPIHGLNFKSGMIQGWNKLCFSGATYYEVSVSLPGNNVIGGFWPGVWTEGNLGRPGYGATVDGTWPYSYDSCDIGTLPNQTYVNGTGPTAALFDSAGERKSLSYLPGQRLSSCTCSGDDHPGPRTSTGGYFGRSAPELDIIEAQINIAERIGDVSQSLQCAPFDASYQYYNDSSVADIHDPTITKFNSYLGGVYQQAVSAVTNIPTAGYADTSGEFNTYGMEVYSIRSDRENAYVTWVSAGEKSWTVRAEALRANAESEVGPRLIAEEPMALVFNFGLSDNFQSVDFNRLTFPNHLYVDYVRVYQRPGIGIVGCDTAEHPTADYINSHIDAYTNPNITTYEAYLELHPEQALPRNSLQQTC